MLKRNKNVRKLQKKREEKRKRVIKDKNRRGKDMKRKQLENRDEAVKVHEGNLINAIAAGKWMTAVWKVEDGKIHLVGRTTWEFPKGDMITATDLLRKDCQGEIDETPALAFGSVLPRVFSPDSRKMPFGVVNSKPEETPTEVALENELEIDDSIVGKVFNDE